MRMLENTLLFLIVIGVGITALVTVAKSLGKWKERAKDAEEDERVNKEAKAIQDRILVDATLRERLRREYDQP